MVSALSVFKNNILAYIELNFNKEMQVHNFMKNLFIIIIFLLVPFVIFAQDNKRSQVGIDEKYGQVVPSDITLYDEYGRSVHLGDLTKNKPTIISMVYFRCPGICSPLLSGLASTVDKLDLIPGKDYNILTVSFDTREDYIMAAEKKKNYFKSLKTKSLSDGDWRFLTGDSINIARLTDAIGFRFIKDGNDYIHAAVITVVSPQQKITRYLYGTDFLPFDLKLALIEASEGKTGSTISKVVSLCYSYDAQGRKYVLDVTRIAGGGILFVLAIFAVTLVVVKKKKKK